MVKHISHLSTGNSLAFCAPGTGVFSEKVTVGDREEGRSSGSEQVGRSLDGITESPRVELRIGQGQGPVHTLPGGSDSWPCHGVKQLFLLAIPHLYVSLR